MRDILSSETYIGLMSGTSLDGVDIVVVDFSQETPRVIHSATWPYEADLKQRICQITVNPTTSIDEFCQLDVELGQNYADVVNRTLDSISVAKSSILAVGNHGQTIRHGPDRALPYSLQIGDPNVIAAKTGITCVADFRRKDVALGGQGAPLAPAFHQFLFTSDTTDRVIINIGGIANITLLPAAGAADVIGFDTGPGNTLLDYWSNHNHGVAFDQHGKWAASGSVIADLLETMLSTEPYFQQDFPKSTGTEYLNSDWLGRFITPELNAADVQATLVELTALTIARGINQLPVSPAQCYICGGGVHNRYLMSRLSQALPDCQISSTEALGLDPDYVEAVAFAWLARQSMNQRPGNLPSVTRASNTIVLGGIYFAGNKNDH
jgi:anhydro-N-acetylmuramic acid kinase